MYTIHNKIINYSKYFFWISCFVVHCYLISKIIIISLKNFCFIYFQRCRFTMRKWWIITAHLRLAREYVTWPGNMQPGQEICNLARKYATWLGNMQPGHGICDHKVALMYQAAHYIPAHLRLASGYATIRWHWCTRQPITASLKLMLSQKYNPRHLCHRNGTIPVEPESILKLLKMLLLENPN